MNQIPKINQDKSPCELFTGKKVDYMRDFRAEWGELVITKKPKKIASDLTVMGEWAAVVCQIMNGSGVLKVYLINSRKYAYRLQFQRAVAPTWVLDALEQISDKNISIRFEEDDVNLNKYEPIISEEDIHNEMIEMNIDINVDKEIDQSVKQGPNDVTDQREETPMVLMRAIDMIEEV
jgi:hypothetical protein